MTNNNLTNLSTSSDYRKVIGAFLKCLTIFYNVLYCSLYLIFTDYSQLPHGTLSTNRSTRLPPEKACSPPDMHVYDTCRYDSLTPKARTQHQVELTKFPNRLFPSYTKISDLVFTAFMLCPARLSRVFVGENGRP